MASVIGVLLLGLSIKFFLKQQKIFYDESAGTQVRASGRIALNMLAKELRKAGYGFPGGQGITTANNTTITIRSNTDNVSTWLASEITEGSTTSFTVRDAGNFSAADKIVLFNTSTSAWETAVIDSVNMGTDTITVTSALTNSYATSVPNMVSKYHDIVYALDNANNMITKTVDGGAAMTVTEDIANNGLDFDYYDSANAEITTMPSATPSNIRKIEIKLDMLDENNSDATVSLETEVNLRNMG
ncbi:MAG: hypothetical protein VYC17_04665 [Nitrospinota bacterium]|nr:hypothetical protein [Nitrospinota bacterium]